MKERAKMDFLIIWIFMAKEIVEKMWISNARFSTKHIYNALFMYRDESDAV